MLAWFLNALTIFAISSQKVLISLIYFWFASLKHGRVEVCDDNAIFFIVMEGNIAPKFYEAAFFFQQVPY